MSVTDASADASLEPFTRIFAVPAASPWDQDRAAKFDARMGSPLPEQDVVISVRRLGRWSSNQAARYCAAYLRKAQVSTEHRLTLSVEDRPLEFVFRADHFARARRARRLGDLALAFVLAIVVSSALAKSVSARRSNIAMLDRTDRALHANLARQVENERAARNYALILGMNADGRSGAVLMNDLAWIARSKRADTRINALVWNGGALTLKNEDGANPIASSDREVSQVATTDGTVWHVAPNLRNIDVSPLNRMPSVVSRAPSPRQGGAY